MYYFLAKCLICCISSLCLLIDFKIVPFFCQKLSLYLMGIQAQMVALLVVKGLKILKIKALWIILGLRLNIKNKNSS